MIQMMLKDLDYFWNFLFQTTGIGRNHVPTRCGDSGFPPWNEPNERKLPHHPHWWYWCCVKAGQVTLFDFLLHSLWSQPFFPEAVSFQRKSEPWKSFWCFCEVVHNRLFKSITWPILKTEWSEWTASLQYPFPIFSFEFFNFWIFQFFNIVLMALTMAIKAVEMLAWPSLAGFLRGSVFGDHGSKLNYQVPGQRYDSDL